MPGKRLHKKTEATTKGHWEKGVLCRAEEGDCPTFLTASVRRHESSCRGEIATCCVLWESCKTGHSGRHGCRLIPPTCRDLAEIPTRGHASHTPHTIYSHTTHALQSSNSPHTCMPCVHTHTFCSQHTHTPISCLYCTWNKPYTDTCYKHHIMQLTTYHTHHKLYTDILHICIQCTIHTLWSHA